MAKKKIKVKEPQFLWWSRERGKCVRGCAEGDEECGINKKLAVGTTSGCAKMEHWEISVQGWKAPATV